MIDAFSMTFKVIQYALKAHRIYYGLTSLPKLLQHSIAVCSQKFHHRESIFCTVINNSDTKVNTNVKYMLAFFALVSWKVNATEEPEYKVLSKQGTIEVREYSNINLASVYVKSTVEDAGSVGFKPLANYIFGGNANNKEMSMTAPVLESNMTDSLNKVSFVMPKAVSKSDLPKPNDERVILEQIKKDTFLAITFSGRWTERNWQNYQEKLSAYANNEKISIAPPFIRAKYNTPWSIPFMRKNEVLVKITNQ